MKKFEIPFRNLAAVLLLGAAVAGCAANAKPLVSVSGPLPDGSRVAVVSAHHEGFTISSSSTTALQCSPPIWVPGRAEPDSGKGVRIIRYSHWERGSCKVIASGGGTVQGVAGQVLGPLALGAGMAASGALIRPSSVVAGASSASSSSAAAAAAAPTSIKNVFAPKNIVSVKQNNF